MMKIAIVGAGPVGLYAAGLLRTLYPAGMVRVFEKRGENQITGFGYTVHGKSLELLGILDPAVASAISHRGTLPFTRRTLAFRDRHWELDPEVSRNTPIIGVEYDSLIQVLRTHAEGASVELHYGSTVADPEELARDHDLVIVANGANSAFLERFDPMKVETLLAYAWGKSEQASDEMAMSLDTLGDIPFICHKYPISKTTTALIMEVRMEQAAEAEQAFSLATQTKQYFQDGVSFRPIPLCLCRKRVQRNIVCIGDAALAQYFAAGAGLYFGLMQTGLLFHHLDKVPGSVEAKLQAYDAKARDYFRHQWQPNKTLVKKKRELLAGHAHMSDDAILRAMVAGE